MKCIKIILFAFLSLPLVGVSQEMKKDTVPERPEQSAVVQKIKKDTIPEKPERAAFESSYIIDNPTNVLFTKKSMEMQIKHRFGLINGGENDLAGIWAPANIRLGLTYAVSDRWTLGFGTTKFDRLQDFSLKVGILRQTRSDKIPISISYFGDFAIDTRKKENFEFDQDRFSFFHQIIIARRFSPDFSLQIAPSISHYNFVEYKKSNDVFGLAVGGRYKISPQTSILLDYSHPFANNPNGEDPEPGLSVGIEFSTSGHAFQLLISNYSGIVPQKNYMFNQNDFFSGDFLIGFNITRVYKF
jgi:hypothetical protein